MKDLKYPCLDSDDAVDCHEHHCSIENDLATYNNKSNNYNEDGYCWHHFSDGLYCKLYSFLTTLVPGNKANLSAPH